MRYLLDTHTLLWYFDDSPNLPALVAELIESFNVQKYVSVASLWEFTIKRSLGKLDFEGGVETFWEMIVSNKFNILQITEPYLSELEKLPFLHRDPFDRLLIATAITEDMTILTADNSIHQYDVMWTW